jgi:hypothetical protein
MRTDMCITSAKTFAFWKKHADLKCSQLKFINCWPDDALTKSATAAVAVTTKYPSVDSCKAALKYADGLSKTEIAAAALVLDPEPEIDKAREIMADRDASVEESVKPAGDAESETTNTEELAAA